MEFDTRADDSVDEAFYRSHGAELLRYATALVGPSDAADVVSRVVVRLVSGKAQRARDLRAYAMKAVLNESRSWLRRRRPFSPYDSDSSTFDPEPMPEVVTEVMRLPVRQRAAVYLVYWLGMSPSEAAGVMGVKPGTARRYLHLARNRLKEVLGDE
jgi:RNA polymerase sigma factor (sigma-70 family)